MRVTVIDVRTQRRANLSELVRAADPEVEAVAVARDLAEPIRHPDLVLLHVGDTQIQAGDSIGGLLERFRHSWILCYSGGQPADPAIACKSLTVAVFPTQVVGESAGNDFARTLHKVLSMLPHRSSLPDDSFRSTVTGFDIFLEVKLAVLVSALKGEQPPSDRLVKLRKICPDAVNDKGELLVDAQHRLESVARLRRLFFHEASLTGDAECR